jgi:hypothetical protein
MKKISTIKILGLAAIGYVLFSSFKKKEDKKKLVGSVYISQTNTPTGTEQVYSNVGTRIFDYNKNVIYTYDTANIGMTVTGLSGGIYSVVIGDSFMNGIAGFVNQEDVQTI